MKYLNLFLLLLLLLLVFNNCSKKEEPQLAQQAVAPVKPITLTYSIFFPPTHLQAQLGNEFAQEIQKRTNGRVEISVFAGGTLTKAPQVFEGVEQGISDMGMSCFAYTTGRFPVTAALDLPLGYKSGKIATLVANEFIKTINPQELSSVKVLYVHAHGPGLLHTVKPIKKLKDLKGMKIRATGLSADIVKALGAVPVAMQQGETYEALQKGVVDGTFGPIEVLKGWKQAEVIKFTTDCYTIGYTTTMFVIMNKNKWESLPADIQQIFEEVSKEWIVKHGEIWDKIDNEGREFTLSLKNQIINLDEKETKEWNNKVQKVIDDYIQKTPEGDTYVTTIKTLIEKYSQAQ
ncbi:MAG TPA: TRAP transporter substrate-binding protein [bacterium]|nr:TRAP transporter substrate-binding protein [bacterium]HOL47163.1 TRAP transporter substrate-binding protein [bacterium]HPQ18086.1 TRAP transporter substrate-binding protein [bacterium]